MASNIVSVSQSVESILDWSAEGKSVDEIVELAEATPSLQYLTREGIVEILNSVRASSTLSKVKEVISDPTSMGYAGKRIAVTAKIADKLGVGINDLLDLMQDEIKLRRNNFTAIRPIRDLGALYISFIQLLREELAPYQGEVKVTAINETISRLENLSKEEQKEAIRELIEQKRKVTVTTVVNTDGS